MGQYEFPNPEWSDVSEEGQRVLQGRPLVLSVSLVLYVYQGEKIEKCFKAVVFVEEANNVITANNVKKCPEPITLANFWPVTF